MAGAGLIAIKRRIKSVTSTRKITKAMGLVATSKLRKTRTKLEANDKYNELLDSSMQEIYKNYPAGNYNVFTHGNKNPNKLYILLTSDSGLCGGFNASVVNTAVEEFNKDRDKVRILLVGEKGRPYLNRHKYKADEKFTDMDDIPTLKEARQIAAKAIEMYVDSKVGEVYIVFTQFISTVKQDVNIKKILPIGYNEDDELTEYVEFEPNVQELVNQTIRQYVEQNLLNAMINSKASEQGSRMSAMDGATRNADEILDNLKLKFNRARQGAITQELTEIIGGAEALK
jgi:F-type H+-transporting ATPase subunit gamma